MGLHFEWDDEKARSKRNNHGVSFDEAKTVFANICKSESLSQVVVKIATQ